MLVRKFEAKSIKSAIDMVKMELGPEAIILSAKEHEKGFGLGGESSVEVTAAISTNKLREKKLAENKLNQKGKAQFVSSSAKIQKEFIQKVLDQNSTNMPEMEDSAPAAEVKIQMRHRLTPMQYSDIHDEADVPATPIYTRVAQFPTRSNEDVQALKSEINYLKDMLKKFQSVPQHMVSAHAGADRGISYELSFAFKKLVEAGLSEENATEILKIGDELLPTEQKRKRAFVEGWLIKYFLDHVKVNSAPSKGRYQIFVGPTGQGKTTTIIKWAAHLMLKEKKKVAILSGDSVKVGAGGQLKTYANILNVPFGVIDGEVDWVALDDQLAHVDCILIDTAGTTLKGAAEIDRVKKCIPQFSGADVKIHFVQSIMTRDVDAFEVADRYKIFAFDDIIFTRLDEAVNFGFIYNFITRYDSPMHSFGIGSAMPDGFEIASRERFVDLFFHLSKPQAERGQK